MAGRYVIYGAGAIGGVIGGCLTRIGEPTVVIARGEHLAVMQRQGLTMKLPSGTEQVPVHAVGHPAEAELTEDDVVLIAVKSQHTEAVLTDLERSAPPGIAVVCVQNGVANEAMALRRFARVYGVCVMMPTFHLEPGVVEGSARPMHGVLDIGRYPTGSDATAERTADALTRAGFRSIPDEAIMRQKWAKLLMNTGNALEAACGPEARTADLGREAVAEARAVFAAAAIDMASGDEFRARRTGMEIVELGDGPRPGGSTWQSLARSAPDTEVDFLNGEVVFQGRLHGVPTPVNETLRQLANRMVAEGTPPGSIAVDEIEALVKLAREADTRA
ncbi:MAG: ketopantoate reductase family protein [Acidimicrobiales bacterium]